MLLALLLVAPSVRARDSVTGAFEGTVTDAKSGAPIAGASVHFTKQATQAPVAKCTDAEGRFYQGLLQPGVYLIRVSARGLVLGDPGPWLCSGMTGGIVYLKLNEVMGLDEAALRRRLAKGAEVVIEAVGKEDEQNIKELLGKYINVLDAHEQKQEAETVRRLLNDWQTSFVKAVPKRK